MFKGYNRWNPKFGMWEEDEWLTDIFGRMADAKDALVRWGNGSPFDNERELQITKCFGKPPNVFTHGPELRNGDRGICEKVWLRYSEFEILERSDILADTGETLYER